MIDSELSQTELFTFLSQIDERFIDFERRQRQQLADLEKNLALQIQRVHDAQRETNGRLKDVELREKIREAIEVDRENQRQKAQVLHDTEQHKKNITMERKIGIGAFLALLLTNLGWIGNAAHLW
jgi:hypothetical protein